MSYRTVKTLTPVDAAYMAGLIDGEGTVTLSRRHRNDQRQLVVSIANTEPGLLEWALATAGAGKINEWVANEYKNNKHKIDFPVHL